MHLYSWEILFYSFLFLYWVVLESYWILNLIVSFCPNYLNFIICVSTVDHYCFQCLDQGLANGSLFTKSSLLPNFVNTVLLEHSNTFSSVLYVALFLKWEKIYCKKALSNLKKLVRLEEIKLILICTQENPIARNRILPVTKDMMLIINET